MAGKTCLNCDAEIENNFCSNCGQKSDTHRITVKHFLLHDLLHGVWHIDKGILFTLRESILRPGQAALDYIKGKRIRYFNVFYLCLIVIGLHLLLSHWYDTTLAADIDPQNDTIEVTTFFKQNIKAILLGIIPILGLNSFWIFRRLRLNIAEQFILSGFCLLGMLLIGILFNLFDFLNKFDLPSFLTFFEVASFFMIPLFAFWTYYNATKGLYSFGGFFWRMILFYLSIFAILMGFLSIVVLSLTDGKGQFYIDL
jgi:hypothetical protein